MGNVAQRLSPSKPQGAGVSPSSTAESANKVSIAEVPVSSRSPSAGNVSVENPSEQPESNDTSYGVEATAIRKLAASTGTVAILGTTAQTPSKENEPDFAVSAKDVQIVNTGIEDSREIPVTVESLEVKEVEVEEENVSEKHHDGGKDLSESAADKIEGTVQSIRAASSESGRQVPQITETLVASLESSPVEELASRSSPDGAEPNSTDLSGIETQITRSTDIGSDDQIEESSGHHEVAKRKVPAGDDAKSENNESASTKTIDNDISSEQMKTNSLSDVSLSDLDEKEAGIAVTEQQPKLEEPTKTEEPSGESDKSEAELKLAEITPDSASESSQQITKEESTSDVTTDNQQEESKFQGDEERLISSPSDERSTDIEDDDENKRNAAAIKIQSSFRGFKVRRTRSPKEDEDQLEAQLTTSEMENVKEQVEDIIKEAKETTESLRNTPDVDEVINAEDEFPAPPDDALLYQLNEDDQDKDTQSLNIEPVPYPNADVVAPVKPVTRADTKLDCDEKQSPLDNDESTTAELARMTADEDLPAPDFELLESSCTEDLNTEVANSDKVLDDEPQDSTEGDVTIEEDSDKLKELQKPQECNELNRLAGREAEVDADIAATKIQANVRGFLARKQVEQAKQEDGDLKLETGGISREIKTDSFPVVEAAQQDETTGEKKAVEVFKGSDVADESVAKESDLVKSRNGTTTADSDPTLSLSEFSGKPKPSSDVLKGNVDGEEMEQKHSPTPQPTEGMVSAVAVEVIKESSSVDKERSSPQILPSETSEMVEPPEGPILEPSSILDEALDKMSSQSDSISQDTISQNTVEELLKQQDRNLTPNPSIDENKQEDAISVTKDTTDNRKEDDIIADSTIIKTLPESDAETITINADEGKDQPANIEPVSEQLKAITPDITDREGNENSSQSIEELSSNPDRESLNPSNENSTIDLPDLSSAEETKGSSTASITSDSAKEKTSDANELTRESDYKAATDIDVEETPASEMKKPDENDELTKVSSEPQGESSEAPKDIVPSKDESAPSSIAILPSDDVIAPSNGIIEPPENSDSKSTYEQSTNGAPGAEDGKVVAIQGDEDITTTRGSSAEEIKKKTSSEESEPVSLKNGSLHNNPSELDDELLNNSATKIQANVRGYLSRKKQSNNQSQK